MILIFISLDLVRLLYTEFHYFTWVFSVTLTFYYSLMLATDKLDGVCAMFFHTFNTKADHRIRERNLWYTIVIQYCDA